MILWCLYVILWSPYVILWSPYVILWHPQLILWCQMPFLKSLGELSIGQSCAPGRNKTFTKAVGSIKWNLITAHLTAEANGKTVNNTVYRKILYREIYPSSVTEFKPPTELPWDLVTGIKTPTKTTLSKWKNAIRIWNEGFVSSCLLLLYSKFSVCGFSYLYTQVTREAVIEFIYNELFLVREKLKYLN